ncbi:MAG: Ribosomal protein S12 methylthiotransferase RimO [candidate division WS2 bacterium]|nr:Ribosomal protein S12 methylthiotransferase RimO [Candidatus Lithacetigena glycinireducens]
MKYYLVSLGCPKNRVDSEVLASHLVKKGDEIVSHPDKADTVVINTCSFIKPAVDESLEEIHRLSKLKEKSGFKLILAGCLVDRFSTRSWHNYEGVDMAVSSSLLPQIPQFLKENKWETLLGPPGLLATSDDRQTISTFPYAYIKLSEGCDVKCSYCTIPNIKGQFRSRPLDDIVSEAENLLTRGIKELVLVSQDSGFYGKDLNGQYSLVHLLKKLNELPGSFWIRLMYLNPLRINDELIDTLADLEKVVKYIDLPLQHTHDDILKLMGRPYRYKFIVNLLEKIRKAIPEVALRSSFIIGFPGESRKHFSHLLHSLSDMRIPKAGFFPYYPEENTHAFSFAGRLPSRTVSRRLRESRELQASILEEYNKSRVGSIRELLVESNRGIVCGRLQYDAPEIDSRVYIQNKRKKVTIGEFVKVKIIGHEGVDLKGKLV